MRIDLVVVPIASYIQRVLALALGLRVLCQVHTRPRRGYKKSFLCENRSCNYAQGSRDSRCTCTGRISLFRLIRMRHDGPVGKVISADRARSRQINPPIRHIWANQHVSASFLMFHDRRSFIFQSAYKQTRTLLTPLPGSLIIAVIPWIVDSAVLGSFSRLETLRYV